MVADRCLVTFAEVASRSSCSGSPALRQEATRRQLRPIRSRHGRCKLPTYLTHGAGTCLPSLVIEKVFQRAIRCVVCGSGDGTVPTLPYHSLLPAMPLQRTAEPASSCPGRCSFPNSARHLPQTGLSTSEAVPCSAATTELPESRPLGSQTRRSWASCSALDKNDTALAFIQVLVHLKHHHPKVRSAAGLQVYHRRLRTRSPPCRR